MLSGIAWTSVNPEDQEKLSPPTGFFTGTGGEQKYQEAIIDCDNTKNKDQPWCTAWPHLASDWNKTDLKSIKLLTSSILPPVLDYRWEGIKEETTSNNDSFKRFSGNKKSMTTGISVMGKGPMIVDTEINLGSGSANTKPILYWRLVLDEIQNGKTQSTINVCASLGDNCTSVATRQDAILDPLRWIHLRFGYFDVPTSILFVDTANEKFLKSTWLSKKFNMINYDTSSPFTLYRSKQEIYFQNSENFRKIKQPENTVVFLAQNKESILHVPNVPSGCWQILYYGAFDLIQESCFGVYGHFQYDFTHRQTLKQNSMDDWSLVQLQLNSTCDLKLISKEWKFRGRYKFDSFWILGDIRECFGDVRVSKLFVPAGVKIEDIKCTAIKTGTTFSFSNSSPLTTTANIFSSVTWFYVSMSTIAILFITFGLILWYHSSWRSCTTSNRSDDQVPLVLRNPNIMPSVRYTTSQCQNSAPVDGVVYDEIDISKNPGPSGKSRDISNHNNAPKSHTLEPNDDVVYEEIKITANPGPSSESVYYSNQKAKEVYDRPNSAMYHNVNSRHNTIYEN